eukprot:CAMPEP_0117662600 /NCGR_PEP_ID=MMETSP0804-20121206/8137_1 /TAXON_ID=1074897 /ORGANISM="Tetraselmis astigmatica, Strain CCMP880" /LENGTH=43 /DNA_ID= /DNA_START= /DNA_END= /DNA_ORIENTATION=
MAANPPVPSFCNRMCCVEDLPPSPRDGQEALTCANLGEKGVGG